MTFRAAGVPLDLLAERDHWVPVDMMAQAFEKAARLSGDPTFGVQVGLSMDPASFGLWIRYALQAPTLGQAIARAASIMPVHQVGGALTLMTRPGDRVAWRYGHAQSGRVGFVQHTDHIVAPLITFVRRYLGPAWLPDWIEVGYGTPDHVQRLEDFLPVPWRFGRKGATIVFPRAALSAPNPSRVSADTPMITENDVWTEATLGRLETLSHRVSAILRLRLLDKRTDIDGAAEVLGIGRRTLQRHLNADGTTYSDELMRARMERAEWLLTKTDLPVTTIALDLGYSEAAHFTRAFRGRFGTPPSRYRNRAA